MTAVTLNETQSIYVGQLLFEKLRGARVELAGMSTTHLMALASLARMRSGPMFTYSMGISALRFKRATRKPTRRLH